MLTVRWRHPSSGEPFPSQTTLTLHIFPVLKIDTEKHQELAMTHKISALPTVVRR